jgi:hypothetical protein
MIENPVFAEAVSVRYISLHVTVTFLTEGPVTVFQGCCLVGTQVSPGRKRIG